MVIPSEQPGPFGGEQTLNMYHAVTGLSSAALKGSHKPVKQLLDVSDATIEGI